MEEAKLGQDVMHIKNLKKNKKNETTTTKKNILSAGCQAISQWLLVRLMSSISWWPAFLAGGLYWQKHSFLCCSGNTLDGVLWMLALPMIQLRFSSP